MKLNVLVVATEKWNSREVKHARVKKLMEASGALNVTFTTRLHKGGAPTVYKDNDGTKRISQDWFENNISRQAKIDGFNHVIFAFSMKEGDEWDVDSGLRGSSFGDKDYFGEGWVKSDENSVVKFKDGTSRDRYEKTLPHEIAHCLKRHGLTPLEIHDYDYKTTLNKLDNFYKELVITKEKEKTVNSFRITDLTLLLAKLLGIQREKAIYPFAKEYPITQAFGAKNSLYKQTGQHIGTDYATPVATSLLARLSGTVIETGKSKDAGNYLIFTTAKGTFRYCHLHSMAEKGEYKQGDVIAFTGNTGLSTGPHCHEELWKKKVNLAVLSPTNVRDHLLDSTKI